MAGVEALGARTLMLMLASLEEVGIKFSRVEPVAGTLSIDLSYIRLLIALYLSAMKESLSIW